MEAAKIKEVREMIQKLRSSLSTCEYSKRCNVEVKIKELIDLLDFLWGLEMEERSRLKYFMADLVEMAQDIVDIDVTIQDRHFNQRLKDLQNDIEITKMRMMSFGGDEKYVGGEEEKEVAVGLEEDVKELLEKVILNESCDYNTWYIKGMVGIGKTTLARQVYNHKDVVARFACRGWVSYCRDMSNKEVLMKLMQHMVEGSEKLIQRDSLEEKDNRSLRQMLRHHLKGKRFFIVFDNLLKGTEPSHILRDIWDKEDVDYRSRELCTSRYEGIESSCYNTHNMKPLDSGKSWLLFLKTIDKFTSDENKFTKELERKGREMLKKCGGLPVAIIDVARQKAKQRLSGIEWEQLFDSIDLDESLMKLEPMYHELDEELKPFFLHMSFFKENALMREEKLEQIWTASGLYTRGVPEEPGEGSCASLVKDSIIDVVNKRSFYSKPQKYHINPLLHMISIKKAEEEMGFEIFRSNGNSRFSQNPRHRVIHCGRDKFNHSTNQDAKHLISIIFHGGGGYLDDASPSYWESFELVKILDMEDFGVKTLSETIGSLIELRYLGLRNNYVQEIPDSFGGLKKLEILDIDLNFMVEVSDIIKDMGSLRNLHMSDVICRKPLKVDALPNLNTLTYISIYDWTYDVSGLETMTSLKKLGIEEVDENSDVGMLFASLANLKSLYHLILRGFRFKSMPCLDEIDVPYKFPRELRLDGLLDRLPSADNFLRYVRRLVLVNTCLTEDPMPVLENLISLRRLKMRNAYTGREIVIQNRKLRIEALSINELWNLIKVQVGRGAMYNLMQLEIKNCPHLDTLPEEIGSMKNLKAFRMVTTKRVATKIRNSGLTSKILEVDITP